jgi:hypothetical protein
MLQNAVLLVSKLSQIRDINDNLVAVGSLPLDYTTYSDILKYPVIAKVNALLTTHTSKRRITSSKVTWMQAMNSSATT